MPDSIGGRDVGWGIVTRLVTITPGEAIVPPVTYLRCEGAGGTVCLVAANDPDDAPQTFTLAAHEALQGVAVRLVKSAGTSATGLIGGY